jgi:hypothetical protein
VNIFALDEDPRRAAADHCDKHVVKMVLETAQMLSTALGGGDGLYKPAYQKHPCTLWVGETRANFQWTVRLGIALAEEYTRRYGKVHKSLTVISLAASRASEIPAGPLTPHAQAMPAELKDPDAITAYRRYYRTKSFAAWKRGPEPTWWAA